MLLLTAISAFAHGDLKELLADFDSKIKANPTDISPRASKTFLLIDHSMLKDAEAEITKIRNECISDVSYPEDIKVIRRLNASLLFKKGDKLAAVNLIKETLAYDKNVGDLRLLGAVLSDVPSDAAPVLEEALNLDNNEASFFLECAALYEKYDRSHAALIYNKGIKKFGFIPYLVKPAVLNDAELNRQDDCLSKIDTVLANLPRKEQWLVLKAQILHKFQRFTELAVVIREFRDYVSSIPQEYHGSASFRKLISDIDALKN